MIVIKLYLHLPLFRLVGKAQRRSLSANIPSLVLGQNLWVRNKFNSRISCRHASINTSFTTKVSKCYIISISSHYSINFHVSHDPPFRYVLSSARWCSRISLITSSATYQLWGEWYYIYRDDSRHIVKCIDLPRYVIPLCYNQSMASTNQRLGVQRPVVSISVNGYQSIVLKKQSEI